jgi:hypothetical protein
MFAEKQPRPTQPAVDRWVRGKILNLFVALGFLRFDGESRPAPPVPLKWHNANRQPSM